MDAKFYVGQLVEVVGTPYVGLTGVIVEITASRRYHVVEIEPNREQLVFLARQLRAVGGR